MGNDPLDRVPMPPGGVDQGLPPRQVPYLPAPASTSYAHAKIGEHDVVVHIVDTPTTRLVTFWDVDAFKAEAERMLRYANGGSTLTTADLDDLRSLADPSQIIGKDGP